MVQFCRSKVTLGWSFESKRFESFDFGQKERREQERGLTDMKPLFFHNLKNLGLKNKGTEGKCFQVYERSSGRIFAMKRARVYPDGEGVPYYMLRELAFLSSSHNHICNLQRVHLHDSSLHVFFEYVHTTLHDLINPTKLLHAGKALPRKQVKVFMWQLLSAVAYCPPEVSLHRNLKPKHILVKDVKNSLCGQKTSHHGLCACQIDLRTSQDVHGRGRNTLVSCPGSLDGW